MFAPSFYPLLSVSQCLCIRTNSKEGVCYFPLAFGRRKMDNLRYVTDTIKSKKLSILIISRWWQRSIGFYFFLGWLGLPSILQFHNICCRYNVCYIPWSICEVPQILLQRSWFKFPLSICRCYRLHIHVHNDVNSSFICDIRI